MQYMKPGENTLEIDKGLKNKWRWVWLEEIGRDGKPFSSWCKKLSETGACFCTLCSRRLIYASSGKKVLRKHESDPRHLAAVRAVPHTTRLPGATTTSDVPASITDRVCELKIRVCAFLAEHDLSFTLSQPLVELCKKVAEDKIALSKMSISNQLASYFNTHGITPEFKRQISTKLKNNMFSLNVDEATNNNMDKVLNVLVRFFDNEENAVKTQHLASRKMNIANAAALTQELKDVLQSYGLGLQQVTSILLDNCAVMRGKKSGLETQLRRENPHLLDISGDTVHMVSNGAKAMMSPFKAEVEDFCSDVFYDIEKSPKQKEIFSEFQRLLHLTPKSLIRPISNRFLQMLEVCNRVRELLDVLIVHYYNLLDPGEEHKYRKLLKQVLERHEVSPQERARIEVLQGEQATASRTQTNQSRKERISVLFTDFDRLTVLIDLFRGVLPTFQAFLKKLQHEKPMVHLLHVEMLALVRELLSKFMKPGAIPLSVKEILKINVRDAALQLPNKSLCVGKYGYSAMTKARVAKTLWVGNLYNSLREGYMKAAEFLLKNLPLDNHMVTSLSALTPSLIQCDSLGSAFMALGKALPNVVPPEALGPLREEVRAYQIDADLVPLANTYVEENSRVDVDWWSQVALLRNSERGVRYPTLIKLVKALLSIFTGPLVEGSFNIMDDILEADRCRMNVETYESLAIIKSTMKARKWTASTMLIDQPLRNSCLSSYKTYQLHLEKKKAREQGMREKRMSEAMRVRSTAVANRIVTQAKKSKGPSSSSTRPAASPRPTRPSPKTISSAKTRPFRPTGPSTTSSGAAKKPSSSSSGPSASSSGATNKPSASSSGPSASSSGPSASSSGPSAFSSGPSASSSGPSASSSGPSTASSGQPKLFSLFHGPAKKSSSIASTTSGKRKSSDDSEPGKKRKK